MRSYRARPTTANKARKLAKHLTIVHSFPRIHVGLLDLGHTTHRDHGGAGFCIGGLPVEIEIRRGRSAQILGLAQLDRDGQRDLRAAIGRMRGNSTWPRLTVALRNVLPQHVGLGSKTATILGTLKALDLFLNAQLDCRTLQELSGRGGTSGVGINTFFTGGFVVDCGHPAAKGRKFAPSKPTGPFRHPTSGVSSKGAKQLAVLPMLASWAQGRRWWRSEILSRQHTYPTSGNTECSFIDLPWSCAGGDFCPIFIY